MKKKLIFFLIILISICAISNVSANVQPDDIASDAQNIETQGIPSLIDDSIGVETQNQLTDEADTIHKVDSKDKNFSDIQTTVDSANDGDTIELNGTFDFNQKDNAILINKTLTIVGAGEGATIKLGINTKHNNFFIIDSSASNVVLKNIKFESAANSAIQWNGDDGLIKNCEFTSNKANANGGALILNANNCTISDCKFKDNSANVFGGAIYIGGKYNKIINSEFFNNYAKHAGDESSLTCGGAIYSVCENLTVKNSTFTRNYDSNGNGGAIYIAGMNSIILNSSFNENYISNSSNNTSIIGGGAIYSDCDNLWIETSKFISNNAVNFKGGAIYSNRTNTIQSSYFEDNLALKGNDIFCNNPYSNVKYNDIVLEHDEYKSDSIAGLSDDELTSNSFTFNRVASKVTFISAGLIFEYAAVGRIHVTVDGGEIKKENIKVLNHPEAKITFINNVLSISNLAVGKYTLRVTTTPDERHNEVNSDLSITVKKATAVIKASKLTVALKSSSVWTIKIVDSRNNKPISNMKVTLKVYTGKKYKTVRLTTNSKGVASYKTKSLSQGTHKVIVSAEHKGYNFNTLKSSITVVKQKALKYKIVRKKEGNGGTIMSFVVLNKKTKKGINGVKMKVLIYTGKKYKSYTLKTKKNAKYNGAFGFATNDFSAGKHKVVLKPVSIKYKGTFKTSFKLKKRATKGPKFFRQA
ncbi:hypothetical protein [Methanobrevibacter sp.]